MRRKYFQFAQEETLEELESWINSYYEFNCSICNNIDIQYLVKDNKFYALITYELL